TLPSHATLACLRRSLITYVTPNAFFYVNGRFIITLNPEGNLKITIYALSIERHPGNVSDFKNYQEHLLDNRNVAPGEQYMLYNFELTSSIYDTTKAEAIEFSITYYFRGRRRSFISIIAKVVGRTSTNQLTIRILDLTYLPKPPSHNTPATPSNAKKRQDHSIQSTHTEMDFDKEERTDTPPLTQINQSSSSVRTQDFEVINDNAPNVPTVPERRHRKQRYR
ncbi:hypothetical protein EDB81DRAFT_800946, partial [Dactylonectria macrodidyma]